MFGPHDRIKNRAVTSQRDQSYVYIYAEAVVSSPRPADHTIGEQLSSNRFNLAFLPMELVSDAQQSSGYS